jgi:RNA polymerase sigma-70 factor (ECF subfamily)
MTAGLLAAERRYAELGRMADVRGASELDLIDRFLSSGTEQSFSDLFAVLYPQVVRYFSFRGFANELAEELAQDVLVAVYRKGSTLRDHSLFRPWLFKVAQNTMRQHLRRTQHDPNLRSLEETSVLEKEAAGGLPENDGFLDMISVLNEDERQVMTLRYIDDLSYEEIASVLDLPMGTVKWKIFNSKSRICASLRQNQPEHA